MKYQPWSGAKVDLAKGRCWWDDYILVQGLVRLV